MPGCPDASLEAEWPDVSSVVNPRILMCGPRESSISDKTLGLQNRDRLAFNHVSISLDERPNSWINGVNGEQAPPV